MARLQTEAEMLDAALDVLLSVDIRNLRSTENELLKLLVKARRIGIKLLEQKLVGRLRHLEVTWQVIADALDESVTAVHARYKTGSPKSEKHVDASPRLPGRSVQEAAAALGITAVTVYNRMERSEPGTWWGEYEVDGSGKPRLISNPARAGVGTKRVLDLAGCAAEKGAPRGRKPKVTPTEAKPKI